MSLHMYPYPVEQERTNWLLLHVSALQIVKSSSELTKDMTKTYG